MDWGALTSVYEARRRRPFLERLAASAERPIPPRSDRDAGDLIARVNAASAEARGDLLLGYVRDQVGAVLRLDPSRIDVEQGLFDMGMDSLMALDVKTRLESAVSRRLPSTLTFNYPTVTALAAYLASEVLAATPVGAPSARRTRTEPSRTGWRSATTTCRRKSWAAMLGQKRRDCDEQHPDRTVDAHPQGALDAVERCREARRGGARNSSRSRSSDRLPRPRGRQHSGDVLGPVARWGRRDPGGPGRPVGPRCLRQARPADGWRPTDASGRLPGPDRPLRRAILRPVTAGGGDTRSSAPPAARGVLGGARARRSGAGSAGRQRHRRLRGHSTWEYSDIVKSVGPRHIDLHAGTGTAHNTAAGRISYVLGLRGPCMAVDTACSSSLVAVHLACESLRRGESRLALAGGVNAIVIPDAFGLLTRAGVLAPDLRCKTLREARRLVRGKAAES